MSARNARHSPSFHTLRQNARYPTNARASSAPAVALTHAISEYSKTFPGRPEFWGCAFCATGYEAALGFRINDTDNCWKCNTPWDSKDHNNPITHLVCLAATLAGAICGTINRVEAKTCICGRTLPYGVSPRSSMIPQDVALVNGNAKWFCATCKSVTTGEGCGHGNGVFETPWYKWG